MDRITDLMSGAKVSVVKEPRGFIRLIQFVLAIIAFATTCSHESSSSYTVHCSVVTNYTVTDKEISYGYGYPFKLTESTFETNVCNASHTTGHLCCDISSAAQFYVFVGVMAFLYTIVALILYIIFADKYANDDRVPIVDLVVTGVFAVLFLIASSAWAGELNKLKLYTDPKYNMDQGHIPDCPPHNGTLCTPESTGDFGKLNASILFGFLDAVVWVCSMWFLYKETKWHKEPSKTPQHSPNQPYPGPYPTIDQGQI